MTTTSDPGPLATTTKRTTRPTADGDVAGANRTMTMRGGDAHPALDGGAGRGRGMMMPPRPQPPPPSSHHRRRPRIIAVAISVVFILPPPTPRVVCRCPRGSTRRPSTRFLVSYRRRGSRQYTRVQVFVVAPPAAILRAAHRARAAAAPTTPLPAPPRPAASHSLGAAADCRLGSLQSI